MAMARMILRQGLPRVLQLRTHALPQCRTITAEVIRLKTHHDEVRERSALATSLLTPCDQSMHTSQVMRQITECTKKRDAAGAIELLQGVEQPSRALRNAVLNTCAKACEYELGVTQWHAMPEKCIVSYNIMIGLSGSERQLGRVDELWEELLRDKLEPSVLTYTALLKSYGQCGAVEKAMDAFSSMKSACQPDSFAFAAVMSVCARVGDYARTRELFMEMTAAGIPASCHHFNSMLTSCANTCDAATAEGIFALMPAYKLKPRVEDYTALITCCRRDVERCRALLQEMQGVRLEPNKFTFEKLIQVELEGGNREQAGAFIAQAKAKFPASTPKIRRFEEELGNM